MKKFHQTTLVTLLFFQLNAQVSNIDNTFISGTGFNNTVFAIALQPDGKIIVGGDFTFYNNTACNRIVRLNNNGSLDVSFNIENGFNEVVYDIVIQQDGKIIVGGGFWEFNGVGRRCIARLSNNGSLDNNFNPGTGFNGGVYCLAQQPDGKIIVGGGYSRFNGIQRNYLARLNNDGSLDNVFNSGTTFNNSIESLLLEPNGKVIVSGDFTLVNSVHNRIVRLNDDGSLDLNFILELDSTMVFVPLLNSQIAKFSLVDILPILMA